MDELTRLEKFLLQELQDNQGDVVKTETLAAVRLSASYLNEANRVASHIKNLRRKLPKSFIIETVRGKGYRLIRVKR